ncbi:MAG: hypothetical protein H6523_12915 [Mycolicibacterium sp.]|nr:hypothetical protein [Mycolicibacterium sp.]
MAIDPPDPDLSFALSDWGPKVAAYGQRLDHSAEGIGTSIRNFTDLAKGKRLDDAMERLDGARADFRNGANGYSVAADAHSQMRAAAERYQASGIPLADVQAAVKDEDAARATMMRDGTGASEVAYRAAQKRTADKRAQRQAALDALTADATRIHTWVNAAVSGISTASASAMIGGQIGGQIGGGSGGWDEHASGNEDRSTSGTTDPHADGPGTSTKPIIPTPPRYDSGVDTTPLTPAPGAQPGDPTENRYGPVTLDDLTPLPYPSTSATPLPLAQTPTVPAQPYPGGRVPSTLPEQPQSTGDPSKDLGGADTTPLAAAAVVPAAVQPAAPLAVAPAVAAPAANLGPAPSSSSARGPVAHLSAAGEARNATASAAPGRSAAQMPQMPYMPAGAGGPGRGSGDGRTVKAVLQSAEEAEMNGMNTLADAVRGGTILRRDGD